MNSTLPPQIPKILPRYKYVLKAPRVVTKPTPDPWKQTLCLLFFSHLSPIAQPPQIASRSDEWHEHYEMPTQDAGRFTDAATLSALSERWRGQIPATREAWSRGRCWQTRVTTRGPLVNSPGTASVKSPHCLGRLVATMWNTGNIIQPAVTPLKSQLEPRGFAHAREVLRLLFGLASLPQLDTPQHRKWTEKIKGGAHESDTTATPTRHAMQR